MAKKVVILGGGVAGLSAAHELSERGFAVQVFERKKVPGGKARSVDATETFTLDGQVVSGAGTNGRRALPGEHGFRFFPRFYKHLPDTMSRIPYKNNRHGVADNLVDTTRLEFPLIGKPPIITVDRFPRTVEEFRLNFHNIIGAFNGDYGLSRSEIEFFAERIWQIMTSCQDRRLDEYERLDWWDYIGAKTRSQAYQRLLAGGLTRSLNACKATLASTKTIGDILVQLMLDILMPGVSSDRLLNGPTNTVWMEPWLSFLRSRGVVYQTDVKFERINMKNGMIESVTLSSGGNAYDVSGDYYVCAIPLERMVEKLNCDVLAADPSLRGLEIIKKNVQWMNGIQFYLNQDIPIVHGHCSYVDTAWALTSVSQAQFWPGFPITSSFGNGTVKGILSVDISEWEVKGSKQYTGCKTARDCTHLEIAQETWSQLKESLNSKDKTLITDDLLHSWFLDPDIIPRIEHNQHKPAERDSEPLLVNYVNSWAYRPDAHTRIPNLFLASDYVRTFTDLATMEGANEAARRATNAIIDQSGVNAEMCKLWNLHEPDFLKLWRASDEYRYKHGLPWNGQLNLLDGLKSFLGA